MSSLRTRWSAIGAAVAVTLGAGGVGLASATSPAAAVTFVPITPCRLFDTRPQFQVGDRGTPLGAGDVFTVTATGNHGNCTGIPTTATAVSMNMTSTDATAPTFLTVWAADKPQPTTSNMNPVPGAPATPNGVIAALSADGRFSTFNLAGTVHVVADINGYYTGHNHDDRYYTKSEVITFVRGSQWGEIPSGMTVTGTWEYGGPSTQQNERSIQLPGIPPVALTTATVNFAPDAFAETVDDDPTCTGGGWDSPTAPPGKVCIYINSVGNAKDVRGDVNLGQGSFLVRWARPNLIPFDSTSYLGFAYAYTAP